MLIHTRKGTTIVTQQEKVTHKTRQEMNNLFQRLCSVRSFSTSFPGFSPTRPTRRPDALRSGPVGRVGENPENEVGSFCCRESIFSYLRLAVFILSQANFYSINFLKVRHFPGKIANKPLPGVFSWSCSPATIDFQKRPSSDVYMARDLSRIWRSLGRLAA